MHPINSIYIYISIFRLIFQNKVLLYESEVWGIYGYKEIDKLHLQFCKHILNVKQQNPTWQFTER